MTERMSAREYLQLIAGQGDNTRNKYGAVRTKVDGRTFASKAEADRYGDLKLLQRSGAIADLTCQPRFVVSSPAVVPPVIYVGDFRYIERGREVVEDVKGAETKEYKIKRRLFRAAFPAIDFREIRKGKSR